MRRSSLIVLLLTTAIAAAAQAETITVDPSGAADYLTIQEGIGAAVDGDTVLVWPGVYTGPDNRDIDLGGRNIHLLSSGGWGATAIDCEDISRAFHIHSDEDTTATIAGFTIVNGHAENGGAVLLEGASVSFRDCVFDQCTADEYGSAIRFVGEDGSPGVRTLVIHDCVFEANSTRYGGVVSCLDGTLIISGSEFQGNTSSPGACGVSCLTSACTLRDCLFAENEGTSVYWSETGGELMRCSFENNDGVGVDLRYSSATLRECTFYENHDYGYQSPGGAVRVLVSAPLIEECSFIGNRAWFGGAIGGIHSSPTVTRCTFEKNRASRHGQSVYVLGTDIDTPTITNCGFFGEDGYTTGGGVLYFEDCFPSVHRSAIAFAGGPAIECGGTTTLDLDHCVIYTTAEEDSLCANTDGVLFEDPLWCDIYAGDFGLCSNSPCLPENNPWSVEIGPLGLGCDNCATAVVRTSWGSIKALYR